MRLALIVLFFATAANAQQLDPWQLVGHTTTTHLGDEGLRALTLACQSDFGPAARMCKTTEVADTIVWPTLTTDAWVRPVRSEGTNSDIISGEGVNDCGQWTLPSSLGMAVLPSGAVYIRSPNGNGFSCGTPRPVACCKRVPEPSASLMLPMGGLACVGLAKTRI